MSLAIEMIIFGAAMLVLTLIFRFFFYKKQKNYLFWSGTHLVLILAVLGIVTQDVNYFAGILGYVVGDLIGNFVGWNNINPTEAKTEN